jgi:pimeloyl-ACP methyl ester carboxylesterase
MKLALLLPGYVESPDYHHLVVIDQHLTALGYTTLRVDPCNLWQTGDGSAYSTTGYINQVKDIVNSYLSKNPTEIILIGHSLGSLVALMVGHLFDEVSKVICLSSPASLNNSDHKWIDGFRTSKKDLPDNPTSFRNFTVPVSFTTDRKHYSIPFSLNNNQKPLLVIMGDEDPSTSEIESIVKQMEKSQFIKIKNMGHDFRQSEELCQLVASKIDEFISK